MNGVVEACPVVRVILRFCRRRLAPRRLFFFFFSLPPPDSYNSLLFHLTSDF